MLISNEVAVGVAIDEDAVGSVRQGPVVPGNQANDDLDDLDVGGVAGKMDSVSAYRKQRSCE